MQDALEEALGRFADSRIEVVAAGRTDTGVHATAQVVHFDSEAKREMQGWVRGTNTFLHEAARVVWATQVADDFHARYSARARSYAYLLSNEPVAPAVLRGRVGWFHRPLDVNRMQQAAASLVGVHDFTSFRDAECQAKSPVRTLHQADVHATGSLIVFRFRANAFLHHMVRNMVGSLVYVGCGRQEPAWTAQLLEARDRTKAAPTFAAEGLYLTGVEYDPAFSLPAFRSHPLLP